MYSILTGTYWWITRAHTVRSLKCLFIFKTGFYFQRSCWHFTDCASVPLQIAVLISVGFIGCWAPYGLVSLWSIFHDSSTIPPEISLLPCMFAKSSTVYNPMIYYIFSQSFKREVKQLGGMCLGYNSCHVSSSINHNMVSADNKPKIASRSSLQESKIVTLV